MDQDMLEDFSDYFYDFADFEQPSPLPQEDEAVIPQSLDDITCDVEGKLYIQLKNLKCHKRWYQKFTCILSVGSFEQKIHLRKSSVGCNDAEAVAVFDIYEYFGPATVSISLQLGRVTRKCVYSTTLHHICSRQESRSPLPPLNTAEEGEETLGEEAETPPTQLFWGVHDHILLEPVRSSSSAMGKTHKHGVACEVFFTYTPVKLFVSMEDNNAFRSAVQNAPPEVLCDILETLSRNQFLKHALSLRTSVCEESSTAAAAGGGGGGGGCLPLEHALLARNTAAVRVLLRRAGNWCFQSTPPLERRCGTVQEVGDQANDGVTYSPQSTLAAVQLPVYLSREHYRAPYQASQSLPASVISNHNTSIGSALHAAVMGGSEECLGMLLRFVRKYHSHIVNCEPANSHAELVDWAGARSDGYTPLMLACALGRTGCIRLLLAEGASLSAVTEPHRLTPLMLACASGSLVAVAELLSHFDMVGSNLNANIRAYMEKDTVNLMKCAPYAANIDGKQALGMAAEAGHADIVEYCIEQRISHSHKDMFGNTALHLAAGNGHIYVCRVIIEAEVKAVSRFNRANFTLRGDSKTDKESPQERKETSEPSSHDYSAVPAVGVSNHRVCASPARNGVLTDMTPRPAVLRAVDQRGRTAAEVAGACGHWAARDLLLAAESGEQRIDHALHLPVPEVEGGGEEEEEEEEEENKRAEEEEDKEEEDSLADDIAYTFSKTLYFDPPYDAVFEARQAADSGSENDDSDKTS
jgi:ankyrin repeat protein